MKEIIAVLCPAVLAAQNVKPYVVTHIEHGIKTDSIVLVDGEKEPLYETTSGRWFVSLKSGKSYRRVYVGINPKARKKRPVIVQR